MSVELMNEDEWFDKVDEILNEKGLDANTNNDGWGFWYENGNTPEQAVHVMING